ncbi:hypothetical protein ATZ99_18990 [Thermovenabulum gondwanense]|uniref:Uncharacterized protein n=1 Tax=Thermovenabulum gondwanense TaxID=520767 RepID=A0A162M7N8_9FIRM|nr:hypothetical protein ATZ99_18990 [Thermovenabulum gondwanense]
MPEEIFAGGEGKRRIIDNDVTDFPQPDSPTKHKVSPLLIKKLTLSTAVIIPYSVEKLTVRFSISSNLLISTFNPP